MIVEVCRPTLSRLSNSLNISLVIPLTNHVKLSSDSHRCCQERILCSVGMLSKENLSSNSSRMLPELKCHPVQRQMSILQKIESCVCRSTSKEVISISLLTYQMLRPLLMLLQAWWCWWNKEEDGWMELCLVPPKSLQTSSIWLVVGEQSMDFARSFLCCFSCAISPLCLLFNSSLLVLCLLLPMRSLIKYLLPCLHRTLHFRNSMQMDISWLPMYILTSACYACAWSYL